MDQEAQTSQRLELSEEDLEKIRRLRAASEGSETPHIDPEWMVIAEFGDYYGFAAIEAVLRDKTFTADYFNALLYGGRKQWARKQLDLAEIVFMATSVQPEKPAEAYNKLIKSLTNQART